jgi:hypothetical protein
VPTVRRGDLRGRFYSVIRLNSDGTTVSIGVAHCGTINGGWRPKESDPGGGGAAPAGGRADVPGAALGAA